MEKQVEAVLLGQVQQVGMRFFIHALAQKYSLVGYVQNLNDGTVKVVAIGEEEILHDFLEDILKNSPGNIVHIEKHLYEKKQKFSAFFIN